MICPVCKSNIRDDAVFCPVCGKPVPQETPEIHNIETVELPKNVEGRESSPADQRKPESAPFQEQSGRPVPNETVSHEQQAIPPTGSRREQSLEHSGDAAARHPRPRQEKADPGRQSRPYPPQYRKTPAPGSAETSRGARPHSNNRNSGSMRPLSEKEAILLKNNLSRKAIVAFFCGIFGIGAVAMNLPFSIVGLVLSIIVKNGYRDRGFQKDSDLKLANAAFVCSIIGIVLGVIGLIVLMATGAGIIAALNSLASLSSGGSYYGF